MLRFLLVFYTILLHRLVKAMQQENPPKKMIFICKNETNASNRRLIALLGTVNPVVPRYSPLASKKH